MEVVPVREYPAAITFGVTVGSVGLEALAPMVAVSIDLVDAMAHKDV